MAGVTSEAERLRQCRLLFERAMREGVSVAAARDLVARERWEKVTGRKLVACATRDMGPADEIEQRPAPWMMAE